MSKLGNPNRQEAEIRPFAGMSRIQPHAAGVDIGAHEIVVCVSGPDDTQIVRTFGTCTAALQALAAWLKARHAFDGEARLNSGGQSVLGALSTDVHWSLFPEPISDRVGLASGCSPPTSLSHWSTTTKYT